MGHWRMYIFKFVTCHEKGEEFTQFLLLEAPELGHLVEDCGKGVGPMMSRCRHFWGHGLEFLSHPIWQLSVAERALTLDLDRPGF